MKINKFTFIMILAFVVIAFTIPDKSVRVKINVQPGPKQDLRKVDRDTLPNVEMSVAPVVHQSTRLTYDFHTIAPGVIVRNVRWFDAFDNFKNKKFTARINRVDEGGYVVQTLYAGELKCEFMNIIIEHYGSYKIAVFQVGAYCDGIEYDFRYFGRENMTPIAQFNHHIISCE